jgi:hypothetical protein
MTKKFLIEVEEDIHRKLKEQCKARGVTLKALCSELLRTSLKSIDPDIYYQLPLDVLRNLHLKLSNEKPEDWVSLTRKMDSEIRRRFKV